MDMQLRLRRFLAIIVVVYSMLMMHTAQAAFLQVIQMVNFLANTGITNAGMTPTSVTLQFFDDSSGKPCWSTTLAYLADFTIHSGPGQNCPNLITTITVTPINVATLLATYSGPYTVMIDTTKYSSQITIEQATAPIFDTASGLVATPGTIKTAIQAQLHE